MALHGFKDYFKILGIRRNATEEEIKSLFRQLASKFHPDLNPYDANAESEFKEIHEDLNCHIFLSDLIGRFSEVGQENYSNISSERKVHSLNLDAELNLQITFLEALYGTNKEPSSK